MEKKKKLEMRISQKIVLYSPQDKKVLLVCDSQPDSEASKKYGAWELPGGHVEDGEDNFEMALDREIREELGEEVQYELRETIGANYLTLTEQKEGRVNIIYLGIYKGGTIKLSEKHTEFRWATFEEVAKSTEYHSIIKNAVRNSEIHVTSEELLNDLKRVTADFENYKKRMAGEKDELGKYMVNAVVGDLIPILDNFHMAVEHVPEDKQSDPWVTGITYIEKQFEEVLRRYGVKVMEVNVGDPFDPQKHEAIEDVSTIKDPVSSGDQENTGKEKRVIIDKVLQKGYEMNGKVVRAAKVNVMSK